MSIKQHFETALKSIQAERERELAVAKEKATREKIVPHNQEVDTRMSEAIAEITAKRDQEIADIQAQFAADRTALIEEGARQKNVFAEQVAIEETAVVNAKYDEAISYLNEQIGKLNEA